VSEHTGVSIATIKYYIREGLLPRPRIVGRTIGRYDAAFVGRLELIRELQSRHRLPLREIRALLDDAGPGASLADVELRLLGSDRVRQALGAAIGAIDPAHALPPVTAARLRERSGLSEEDIAALVEHGLLSPLLSGPEEAPCYAEGDARIAEVVGALRRSGYHEQLGFTIADLARYVSCLKPLVVQEVEQFDRPALRALQRRDLLRLIEEGVGHIDVLLGLLHKKLLLLAVHERMVGWGHGQARRTAGSGAAAQPGPGGAAEPVGEQER
jgi:DNA-binding transcriptional MerR regulator